MGVVAGSVISSELNAAEVSATPIEEPEVQVVDSHSSHGNEDLPQQDSNPTPAPIPEPQPTPNPVPGPTPDPEPEINVISYETVTTESGNQMDVALVDDDGDTVMIIDNDRDGFADVMMCDVNHNGDLDEGELVYVSEHNFAMQPLQDAYNNNVPEPLYTLNDETDYTNDANVDEYMA